MYYILGDTGAVGQVSFGGHIACGDETCTEYTGAVPTGYTSLEDWYIKESEQLYKWEVINGQLKKNNALPVPTSEPVFDTWYDYDTMRRWNCINRTDGLVEMWTHTSFLLSGTFDEMPFSPYLDSAQGQTPLYKGNATLSLSRKLSCIIGGSCLGDVDESGLPVHMGVLDETTIEIYRVGTEPMNGSSASVTLHVIGIPL